MSKAKITLGQALDLQSQGLNQSQIAERCGVRREAVNKILSGHSLRAHKLDYWLKHRPKDVAQILNLRESGESIEAIASHHEISTNLVRKILATADPELSQKSRNNLNGKGKLWREHSPIGLLTVISLDRGEKGKGQRMIRANCICDCGTPKSVQLRYLREGSILSCGKGGCMQRARAIAPQARQKLIDTGLAAPSLKSKVIT